jgi:hypothetical protein
MASLQGFVTQKTTVDMDWVLRRIFCPEMEEITGEQKELDGDEVHNFYWVYYFSDIIMVIKLRRMRRKHV